MSDPPVVDGRRREALREHVEDIAPYYTENWDPTGDGPGTALAALFAEMAADVTERLDQVPAKHRLAFFDTLGFEQRPPQPARVPLAFDVAAGAGESVAIAPGVQAVAEATESRPEQVFEVPDGRGFDATPATLARAISVDPAADGVFDHTATVENEEASSLFEGTNQQTHALYVGDAEQLNVTPSPDSDSTAADVATGVVQVSLETATPESVLRDRLVWEYYGEKETDDGVEEGWHRFRNRAGQFPVPVGALESAASRYVYPSVTAFLASQGYDASVLGRQTLASALSAGDDAVRLDGGHFVASVDAVKQAARNDLLAVPDEIAVPGWVQELVPETRTLDLEFTGALTETTVDGVESRWIRARLPSWDHDSALFDVEIGERAAVEAFDRPSVQVGPAPDPERLLPDALLANDVELPVPGAGDDGEPAVVQPFGDVPRVQDAFYVASAEAFTKPGATVTLSFAPPADATADDSLDVDPEVAWEYWDGNAWARIDGVTGDAISLTHREDAASLSFRVPDDLEATTVAGHEGHWVRARLVGGGYGHLTAEKSTSTTTVDGRTVETESWVSEYDVDPPRFVAVELSYEDESLLKSAAHVASENNLQFRQYASGDERLGFAPFERVPDVAQTLYLGFDRPLDDGPVNLLFAIDEQQYPDGFHPRVRWEYCDDPERDEWTRLGARDGTEGLTERGIVGLVFPEETTAFRRFGRELHWVRARVTGDRFDASATESAPESDAGADATGGESASTTADVCGSTIQTTPDAGFARTRRPRLAGLYRNAVWAKNVRTVADEVVGGSDGTPDQSFVVSAPPVTGASVWVDERQALSAGQRDALLDERPDGVDVERNGDEISAFWVEWEAVPDFLDSTGDDRHYAVDRSAGRIKFGDGNRGRIPPRGSDNVKVSYETGGGRGGNVEAGAVGGLKGSIPFVDGVTNPLAADGGADAESPEDIVDRAPKELRDRGRAVTAEDFERVARDASRKLARVRCLPGLDRDGQRTPGWVTLLLVPSTPVEKPLPSVTLKEDVKRAVGDRAAATLVDPDRLVVRGPSYVSVDVGAELVTTGEGSVSVVEERALDAVESFLHPLTGGDDGDGWAFGTLPCRSDLYALLERVEGVDHLASLSLTFSGGTSVVNVPEGDEVPSVPPDALVYSGTHEIDATTDRRGEGA